MRGTALRKRGCFLAVVSILFFLLAVPRPLWADDVTNINYIERGLFRILTAAFQLPRYLVEKTLSEPIILGTLDGALTGTYYTVSSLLGGTLDIVRGAIPYAKYALFFL